MKKRAPKPGSIAYYIEEVVRYSSEYEAGQGIENGYPPIVAELLLSLLIEVRTFCTVGRFALGLVVGFLLLQFTEAVKLLLMGG